ncbi:MAG: hypothetical protein R3C00_01135 [Hyphomonas sp.]
MRRACLSGLLIATSALPGMAETPLERALEVPKEGPLYTFDVKIKDDTLDIDAKVDPSKPEGDRLSLVSPDESALDEAQAKRFADLKEHTKGDVWCSNFAGNIPDDAKLLSESQEEAVYGFTPVPGEDDGDMAKAYKHLTGRVTVSKEKPGITSFEMFSEKPFKPMAIAKVNTFSMKVKCDYAPDGRTYIRDLTFSLAGSAMMQKFSQTEHRQITALSEIPGSATGQR